MAKEAEAKNKVKVPTAEKRMKQNVKRRVENKSFKSTVRTAVRRFEDAQTKNDSIQLQEALNTLFSLMDKGVKRGVYKKNKAARTKARYAAKLSASSK